MDGTGVFGIPLDPASRTGLPSAGIAYQAVTVVEPTMRPVLRGGQRIIVCNVSSILRV